MAELECEMGNTNLDLEDVSLVDHGDDVRTIKSGRTEGSHLRRLVLCIGVCLCGWLLYEWSRRSHVANKLVAPATDFSRSSLKDYTRRYDIKTLVPGEKGICHFHAQRGNAIDILIFKQYGGSVDESSCVDTSSDMANISYSESRYCSCVGPPAAAFGRNFLEIGANNGVYMSNLICCFSKRRWNGLEFA